ncbi:hypothetical protein GGE06_007722 [Streptomyces sp. SFB5A]|uniref:Uncharacterized protein n=1 Tax=Streptomyces nymphaeiformis TaxID=2663842 RepID=A0A7W7U862_9ACTN|nr:hypothetical protein [Streptomyces nymphaeiformis]
MSFTITLRPGRQNMASVRRTPSRSWPVKK